MTFNPHRSLADVQAGDPGVVVRNLLAEMRSPCGDLTVHRGDDFECIATAGLRLKLRRHRDRTCCSIASLRASFKSSAANGPPRPSVRRRAWPTRTAGEDGRGGCLVHADDAERWARSVANSRTWSKDDAPTPLNHSRSTTA
jgi:hypothetical protein